MMQLRVVVAEGLCHDALEILREAPFVSTLAVQPGASVVPDGDVIIADIAREGVNDVVHALREIGVQDLGAIQLTPVDTWISRPARQAEEAAPGAPADAVVWAQVANRSYSDSELNWVYLSFMILETLLAAIAIVTDSQILTIGAMVLGPEFAPIAAIGLAMVMRRPGLLGLAANTLLAGFIAAIAVTTVASLAGRALGWIDLADITTNRELTSFIYRPDKWSIIVAVIAAAAGVLSLTSDRLGGLSGVFISVTTVPAAGNLGLALAFQDWREAQGSALQLVVNIGAMALAGWATLAVQQAVWSRVTVWRPKRLGLPPVDQPHRGAR